MKVLYDQGKPGGKWGEQYLDLVLSEDWGDDACGERVGPYRCTRSTGHADGIHVATGTYGDASIPSYKDTFVIIAWTDDE